jgi:GNAT superfamily N-acetyltransferase
MNEKMAGLTFRDAVPEDADWIAGLLSDEGYPAGGTDIVRRLERYAEMESSVRVAEMSGERLGFIASAIVPRFEVDDRFLRVMAMVVDPSVRDRGVGGALMAEAERAGQEARVAFLEVTAGHHRPEARRLFERAGYDAGLTNYLRKRL